MDTDRTMKEIWLRLADDFSALYGQEFLKRHTRALFAGVKSWRNEPWAAKTQVQPHLYKVLAQMENLFKRYRFEDDVYTDRDLERMALEKFEATQTRVAVPFVVTPMLFRVLQRSRQVAERILGDYDVEEHLRLCRFGKRACQGIPYRSSYLDLKFRGPMTGSVEHLRWFWRCLDADPLLAECAKGLGYIKVDSLQLGLVPKSFKAFRSIMPDTLAGSWYTAGLGNVLRARLKENAGLDITVLQQRHRRLVKTASKDRRLVTADLSAASDSLTLQLLRWILPRPWYNAVTYGRAPYVLVDGGRKIRLSSIVTMGLGHTFPLQTLIFYCLLVAIGELSGRKTFVSVYGDDLIYSRHIHRYVAAIFPAVHLNLNADKTYVLDHFRESCGSDYYRGVDVRPFQPEGCRQLLSGQSAASFLYRIYNGLILRWLPEEIPKTLAMLEFELLRENGVVFQVPPSFPDGSGIRVQWPIRRTGWSPVLWHSGPVSLRDKKQGEGYTWVFQYLHVTAEKREVLTQVPYYWAKMYQRGNDLPEVDDGYSHVLPVVEREAERLASALQRTLVCRFCEPPPRWNAEDSNLLTWRKSWPKKEYTTSRITRRRMRKLTAVVARKSTTVYQVRTGSESRWLGL